MTAEKYNECVGLYADALYRFILKNIREPEDARDVVQNAFEALWINRNGVNPEKIKSWLFTVAYHKMIDLIRKRKRMKLVETMPESAAGSHAPGNPDLKGLLNKALETLPDIQKQLVLLKDYEGYSYTEIGQITGLNESQVKVYLFRARMSLKKTLVSIEQTL
jgi:RNA polymerase sigma-70 factor (ECF subfamily)